MSDQKNMILAIVLSAMVLLGWQFFFNIPQAEKQAQQAKIAQQQQAQTPGAAPGSTTPQPGAAPGSAPSLPGQAPVALQPVTRAAAVAASPRIKIETPRVSGSVNLKGGRIDDLALTNYRETVDPKSPAIVLLSPSGAPNAYYAEFGFVGTTGATTKLPDAETLWRQDGAGHADADHAGEAVMGQWRGRHVPPHHHRGRQLSLHRDRCGEQCLRRAGVVLSVRADFAPRHAQDRRLLHSA